MSEQWRTDLERLVGMYDSFKTLTRQLDVRVGSGYVGKVYSGKKDPGPGFKEAVRKHVERLEKEHLVGSEMVATCLQVIPSIKQRLEEGTLTHSYLDGIKEDLQEEASKICD